MYNVYTTISQLLCLSVAFEFITITLAMIHSVEASSVFQGRFNAGVLFNRMKKSEVSTSPFGADIKRVNVSQQDIDNIFSRSNNYHKQIYSRLQRNETLDSIASALNNSSRFSRNLRDVLLKQHKFNVPNRARRTDSIVQASISDSSFPKQKFELVRNFSKLFFEGKKMNNLKSKYQQRSSSESSTSRRHRHLVKRQSSLITEYCGHLNRERCQSLQVGHCAHMCINGRRHRTVCRLRHPERDAVCIVRTSN